MVIERLRTDTTHVYSDGTDLVFERTFDAPRELVWKAFMDPTLIPRQTVFRPELVVRRSTQPGSA